MSRDRVAYERGSATNGGGVVGAILLSPLVLVGVAVDAAFLPIELVTFVVCPASLFAVPVLAGAAGLP